MVEGGRGWADKIFKPDREALCVPELHSSSSLLLAVGHLPASVLAGRPGRSGIRPRRRASACTSGDIERESTMIPAMEIIQAIGFDASSSSRQNSGSICLMCRTSRISFALLAMVLFGTPVSALRSSPVRWGRCVRSKRKFTLPTAWMAAAAQMRKSPRTSGEGRLRASLAISLATSSACSASQVLATERIGELEELLDVAPERRRDTKRILVAHLGKEDALRPSHHASPRCARRSRTRRLAV